VPIFIIKKLVAGNGLKNNGETFA